MRVVNSLVPQTACVIILHGLGENGQAWTSMIPLVHMLMPHVKFIMPQAEEQYVTMHKMRMPAWFDILAADEYAREDLEGLEKSRSKIDGIIGGEVARGIRSDRIAIVGISQGGALGLYTALKSEHKLAGVAAVSTWLPLRDRFPKDLHSNNAKLRVLQCHGDADQRVPYSFAQRTNQKLLELGLNAKLITYQGLGHSADPKEIFDIAGFLQEILPR
eukprot:TRINITY_DN5618_c0_g1_i1.p1 TRINITY_DN5618_c0_g1~~TRINITY_DN5618_c0_g1_i1.p1  ORF type:complete len:217 (-),score=17.02 TRINITY_DN5618_c0_g1_i1:35-685(-)